MCRLLRQSRRGPQYFYAFDVLWVEGRDLRGLTLAERKQILRRLVPPQPASVLYVEHFDSRGTDLFQAVCELDLEGIVAKRKDGLYIPEETSWVEDQEFTLLAGGGPAGVFREPPSSRFGQRLH